jgi:hypothetical protein
LETNFHETNKPIKNTIINTKIGDWAIEQLIKKEIEAKKFGNLIQLPRFF